MDFQPKSFWKRPEGVTGILFMVAIAVGGGFLLFNFIPYLISLTENLFYLSGMLIALAAVIFLALDPKFRNLISYMYKSVMRGITGLFVQIDPIGILKTYIDSLEQSLKKMGLQINQLRGQMHQLKEVIINNEKEIVGNLALASKAKEQNAQAALILKSRKAGRLQDSNVRLEDLYKKMEILYRVLSKMYENSEVMSEDIKDQVKVKEIERKAIATSHSAMRSAMSILTGDPDKKAMFDHALEAMTEDVSLKMGEMERFMDLSSNFMKSIDLQNGVFEEEGLLMLEKWEKEGVSLLLGNEKETLITNTKSQNPIQDNHQNQYDTFFK